MMRSTRGWVLGCGLVAVLVMSLFVVGLVVVTSLSDRDGLALPRFGQAVGVVEIFGIIGENDRVIEQLDRFEAEESPAALVLHINSPGGSVAATQRIAHRLEEIRQRGVPVIAAMDIVAASGGYYLACVADSILTLPGTLTGSIGAIMSFPEASELMRKIGVDLQVVVTGDRKDAGGIHRPLTEDERRWFGRVLDDVLDQFVAAVDAGRPGLDEPRIRELADGRIFSGQMAVDLGLADRIGTVEEAIEAAAAAAGLGDHYRIVRKRRHRDWVDRVLGTRLPGLVAMRGLELGAPRMEYRWR